MKTVAPLLLIVALVGSGVFFGIEGLDRADKYASVAGFVLALAVAGVTLIGHLRGRQGRAEQPVPPAEQPTPGAGDHSGGPKRVITIGRVTGPVFNDRVDHAEVTVFEPADKKRRAKKPSAG